jgi:hypothetical protein
MQYKLSYDIMKALLNENTQNKNRDKFEMP